MQFNRLAQSLRLPAVALFSILLASCGTGDGEESVDAGADQVTTPKLRLVFRDDFGGPATAGRSASPETAARTPPAPLSIGNWVVDTGYGVNGWGNDEWQLYTNSMDNLFTEDGSLVIRARCSNAPNCGKRDGSITSAKVITKKRLNVRYGNIKARIKMPSGLGMWPAFWTLGSDIDQRPWPDAGEIDIVEMHYFYSDIFTTHFSTHWSGPKYTPATRPVCSSRVLSSLDPGEEENCKTENRTFDFPLTDDFHVYELDWNENRIVGKIDGITYFNQGIDPNTMEEFLKNHYLILNVAVGGTLGGMFGPSMSAADWADPGQTDMLVDWVEVYEKVPPTTATLISESGRNLQYNRIINSAEFNGAFVESKLKSTAVTPLVGSSSLQLKYSTSRSKNGGVPASFSGAIFDFNNLNIASFNKFVFSLDSSRFPGFNDIGIEFEDSMGGRVLVRTSSYTPTAITGNWKTYGIPFRDFAGVDMNDIVRIGFFNPYAASNDVIKIGYVGANTLAGISFGDPNNKAINLDISNLAGGTLEFDALVTKAGAAPWRIKFESEFAAAEVLLSASDEGAAPEVGKWQHYTFQLDTTLGAVDLSSVKYLTFFTSFAPSSGSIQVDNIVFKPAAGSGNSSAGVIAFGDDLADQWAFWDCCSNGGTQIGDVTVVNETLIAGTLYVDDIRFVAETCTATPGVAFNLDKYNPTATTALLSVDDACSASSLVTARITAGTEEIFVGMKLDAAGHGEAIFNLANPISVCSTSDQFSTIALSGSLRATYKGAEATAFIDPGAAIVDIPGDPFYFYATDPGQALSFLPDVDFEYSIFGSGSVLFGAFADTTFDPVFAVTSGTNYGGGIHVAQVALIGGASYPAFNGFAADKGSINFKVKDLPGNQIKVEFGVLGGAADLSTIDLLDTTRSKKIDGDWYEVSIPMTEFPNVDVYNFVAFTGGNGGTAQFTYKITDIYLEESVASVGPECAAPVTAAPTPAQDPADVISLLTSAYSPGAVVDTWRTVWSAATLAEVQLEGTDIKRYANLGFVGIESVTSPIDVTGMTNFRIDVWSPDVTQLLVKWVDFGGDGFDAGGNVNDTEGSVTLPLTAGQWVSLDIPIASFIGDGLTATPNDLAQLILEAKSGTGTIYVSNVYFYNVPAPPPPPSPLGVFSETHTSPSIALGPFINSIAFGGNDTIATPIVANPSTNSVTAYDGNTLEIDYQNTGGAFGGALFDLGGADVSAYTALKFSIDTSQIPGFANLTIQIEPPGGPQPGNNVALASYTPVSTVGTWSTYEIPLSDFPGAALDAVGVVGFWNARDVTDALVYGKLYLDDVHFVGPGPTTLGVFSETHTSPSIALGPFINSIAFGGNNTVATPIVANPSTNSVTAYDGNALEIDYQNTGGFFGGALFDLGGADVSAYTALKFSIDTSQISGFANLTIQIEPPGGPQPGNNVALASYTPVSTVGTWSTYEIPLSDFPGAALDAVGVVGFWNVRDVTDALVYGKLYLDDVYFGFVDTGGGGEDCAPTGANLAVNGDFETGDFSCVAQFENGGTQSISTVNSSSGTYSANINVVTTEADSLIKFANLTPGAFTAGQTIFISFDMRGSLAPGGVAFAEFFSELSGGGTSSAEILFGGGPIFPNADPNTWTNFSTTAVTGSDTSGGITLQLKGASGAGNLVDIYFDNVCVSTSACP